MIDWLNAGNNSDTVAKMEAGLLHPSVIEKIQGQLPYNFYRIIFRRKWQALMSTETSGSTSTSNSTSNLHQPSQGDAFVRSPSKGHDHNVAFSTLLFPVTISVVLTTAVAPLLRVNLLIQSQNEMIKSGRLSYAYKGIGDCFARTVRNEGFFSLWRGNTACVLHFVSGMVQRTMMDSFRINSAFCPKKENDGLEEWFARNFATMALFGGTSILLVYHLVYAQIRMANDIKINTSTNGVNKRQFDGLIDVYRKTLKSDGITGLFRGFNVSCLEFFVHKKLMLRMNAVLNPNMLGLQQSWATTVVLTGRIAICCDLATYPIDTVRRRMMMRSGEAIKYKSCVDAFSQILKNEGVRSLYKGTSAFLLVDVALIGFVVVIGNTLLKIAKVSLEKSDNQSKLKLCTIGNTRIKPQEHSRTSTPKQLSRKIREND
ncbi:hypothetical protein Dsin_021202 [Dipteronia sinensis]|uniref:ADP/ATP translocase n=1 Tax=Dipteronia sinensis TaxID=43782 RepID=A0AAE0AAS6_9ROSI|nr:hypothetical protein Dsin_021202 [Dipteronia sinensis]